MNVSCAIGVAALVFSSLPTAVASRLGAVEVGAPASTVASPIPVTLQRIDFGGDFTLTDQHGRPFRLSDARGKVVLLFFGYTSCPDVCPMTMAKIARAIHLVGSPAKDVETLFVTVDVDHDTPRTLANYVTSFGVPMIGLTGTRAQVDRVVVAYHASYRITPGDSAAGPQISHSTATYLIDRRGQLRYLFAEADGAETIASGIRQALRQTP